MGISSSVDNSNANDGEVVKTQGQKSRPYYLGCPSWANRDWKSSLYQSIPTSAFLARYSEIFNTVEGNTTFYALPKPETVLRWREQVPSEFRFTFKLPQLITHRRFLRQCQRELADFFRCIEPLAELIGLVWIQLPPSFAVTNCVDLQRFIHLLPNSYQYAIEVRNAQFWDAAHCAKWVEWLSQQEIAWVQFDTRGLFELTDHDDSVLEAQRKKPNLPISNAVTSQFPFVRFIAANTPEDSTVHLKRLAIQVAEWINSELRPYVMIHTPNCVSAPETACLFNQFLSELTEVDELRLEENTPDQVMSPSQLDLF